MFLIFPLYQSLLIFRWNQLIRFLWGPRVFTIQLVNWNQCWSCLFHFWSAGNFSFGSLQNFKSNTIVDFIENSVEHSRSGRFLFFMHRSPRRGPMRVQLLNPISRFKTKEVQSLQHMCRYQGSRTSFKPNGCNLFWKTNYVFILLGIMGPIGNTVSEPLTTSGFCAYYKPGLFLKWIADSTWSKI